MAKAIPQLIDGEWRGSRSRELIEVTDPATQDVLALAPKATADEIEQAIASAQRAFETWREVPAPERARLMLRYQHLLKEHHDELGELLARETGKNLADAKGDVWRGIEVVEHAANVASLMMGETVENVAREIDTASWIQPLGVCAGITPFNFPAMIPLWMFPLAIACGNTFVLKPSEQDPLTPNRLAELFLEAGAPKGVLQVIHGGREQVDALLTHPDIRAISFVGSVAVGQHVYRTGTAHLKRVQAFAGAKISLYASDGEEVQELKGARRAIGDKRRGDYRNIEVPLAPGWTFYLSTDGFLDQAGGEHGFGFGSRRFADMLRDHARQPLPEQAEAFVATLAEYQGEHPQRDDITILSFRFD